MGEVGKKYKNRKKIAGAAGETNSITAPVVIFFFSIGNPISISRICSVEDG